MTSMRLALRWLARDGRRRRQTRRVDRLARMSTDVPMARVRANGLDIGYDETGDGPPLVLLHSASSSGREDFAAQLPLLRRSFHCYLPDARGHATTRWDAADGFRYDWLVDDLEAFADALGLATFHLLGFSMGGATALQFAARRPERLRTLVVSGSRREREPRTSVARRMMDPAVHRPRPALGGRPVPAARSRPGRRCLAAADAGDRAGRRRAAPPRAGRPDPDRRPDAGRRRRPGHVRPRRPGVGPEAPAARREAVRRPRLRPRGAGAPAGAVQRGDRRLLPVHRGGRGQAGREPSATGRRSAGGAAPRAGPAGA